MRKHISVFGFFVKSSLHRVLLILAALGFAELWVFRRALASEVEAYELLEMDFITLEKLIDRCNINIFFGLSLIAVTVVLCLPGCAFRSQTGYTLRRLSVSERAVFCHQAAYNALVYLLLLAFQAVMAFVLCRIYVAEAPAGAVSAQTVFLAFYRSELLHALVPLADVALWIRNGLLVLALGFSSAEVPLKQRRKKFGSVIIGMLLFTMGIFERSIGDWAAFVGTVAVFLAATGEMLYTILSRETEEEESEDA